MEYRSRLISHMNLNLFAESSLLKDILSNPLVSIIPGGPKIPSGILNSRRKRGGAITDDIIRASQRQGRQFASDGTPVGAKVIGSLISILGPILLPILIKKGVDAFKSTVSKKADSPEIDNILSQISDKTLQDILDMQPQISTQSKSILDKVIGQGIAII